MNTLLDIHQAKPVADLRGRYAPHVEALRRGKHSGVYAIFRGRECLYVGESHTGNLFGTITRHFRQWKLDPSKDAQGRRRGGTMYDRRKVRVVYVIIEHDVAQVLQYAEIERLRPRDNSIDGKAVDVVPF